jgi:hypothetical protein
LLGRSARAGASPASRPEHQTGLRRHFTSHRLFAAISLHNPWAQRLQDTTAMAWYRYEPVRYCLLALENPPAKTPIPYELKKGNFNGFNHVALVDDDNTRVWDNIWLLQHWPIVIISASSECNPKL